MDTYIENIPARELYAGYGFTDLGAHTVHYEGTDLNQFHLFEYVLSAQGTLPVATVIARRLGGARAALRSNLVVAGDQTHTKGRYFRAACCLGRSFCLPGQRRWHFVHERDSRRKQIIDAVVASGQVSALAYHGKGRDSEIRAESFRRVVATLLERFSRLAAPRGLCPVVAADPLAAERRRHLEGE